MPVKKVVAKKKAVVATKKKAAAKKTRSLVAIIDDMDDLLGSLKDNVDRFQERGVKAAGTRVRKVFQEIKVLCKEGRDAVTAIKAEM